MRAGVELWAHTGDKVVRPAGFKVYTVPAPHVLFHSMAFETMEKYHRRLRQPQIQVNCALLSKLIVTSDPLQESGNVHQNLFQKQNFTTTKVFCSNEFPAL